MTTGLPAWQTLGLTGGAILAVLALAGVLYKVFLTTREDNKAFVNRALDDNTALVVENRELVKTVIEHVADSTTVLREVSKGMTTHEDQNREAHEKLLNGLNEVCGNLKAANGKPPEEQRRRRG